MRQTVTLSIEIEATSPEDARALANAIADTLTPDVRQQAIQAVEKNLKVGSDLRVLRVHVGVSSPPGS